jgi:HD-GYP domain-containing protein (c-di-GMP phosphodiesterase class II)
MRLVSVEDLSEGDRIAMNINSRDGRLIVRQGMVMTSRLIEGLKRLLVEGVYIEDERFKDIQLDGGMGMQFRMQAISALNVAFEEVINSGDFQSRPLLDASDELVNHIVTKKDTFVQLKDMRTTTGYLLAHSINVAILAVLAANALDYNYQQLRVIAIGAMLHDIGYVVPGLENPLLDHPKAGFDLIRGHHEIPLMAAHMVLQHHEMLNGQGFPYGIKGKELREIAQICAIANDFDHHVNEVGENRLPHEGIEYIMSKVESSYEIELVRAFVRNIVPYPVGTRVRLTNGMVGVVFQIDKINYSRPVVREIDNNRTFALIDHHTVFVEEVLTSRDICFS